MPGITWADYFLLPFYLWLIYKIAFFYRDKLYPVGNVFRPYFIPGLTAKIIGAIFIGFVYNYVYAGGDTLNYFYHSNIINSTFSESVGTWVRLITHTADDTNIIDSKALANMYWYDDVSAYTTSCIGAFIGIFCFTKYLIINSIIAAITFIGMWLMFTTFANQYKHITKYIALAILFMPGVLVWGSGLFKDSFCMFSIGCLVYCFYMLFEKKKFNVSILIVAIISIALLIIIKAYILIVLFPALIIKTTLVHKKSLKDHPEKKFLFYCITIIACVIVTIIVKKAAGALSKFSYEDVAETIIKQKNYLLRQSLLVDGSAYDLGDFEPSLNGILKKALPAINVTFFRPYIWESKNIIMLFNAFESLCVLLLSLYLLLFKNIFMTLKLVYKDPNLIMCLFFALIFAFFVGISSYNFGTLSRYKIPCTPFYMLFLMILIFNRTYDETSKNILPAR